MHATLGAKEYALYSMGARAASLEKLISACSWWKVYGSTRGRQTIMTLEEIRKHYPNAWVLIEFTELDDELNVIEGWVIAHASNKEDIYKKLRELENDKIAIEFTGEMPEEPAYLL